jgi:TRAP-type C4-dicarboxylate transport system substrate-binding protein
MLELGWPRRLIAPVALAGVLLSATPAGAQELNLYTYMSVATTPSVRGIAKMAEQIGTETGERVKVRVHLGGSLQIGATSIAAAVSDGVVQMADDAFFAGVLPIGDLIRLPMLLHTDEEYAKAVQILQPYVTAGYAKRGIALLATYAYPKQQAYSKRKLTSLDDMKGQKLRVTSPEQAEFVKRFGATPITMGTPEVPSAVDRGVIDGFFTASSGAGYTWKDLIKYEYTIGVNYVNANIIINQASWDKLAPGDQAIVRKAAVAAAQSNTEQMIREEQDYTKKMVDGGMTLTMASAADIAAAEEKLRPYWDEWANAKGADATEALGRIRAVLGRP